MTTDGITKRFNVPHRVVNGWLPASGVRNWTGEASVTLASSSTPTYPDGALLALGIPAANNTIFYLSFRTNNVDSFDRNLAGVWGNAVYVHRYFPSMKLSRAYARLALNDSFGETVAAQFGVRVTALSTATQTATVSFVSCALAPPSISFVPAPPVTVWVPVGSNTTVSAPVNLTLTNNNFNCNPMQFRARVVADGAEVASDGVPPPSPFACANITLVVKKDNAPECVAPGGAPCAVFLWAVCCVLCCAVLWCSAVQVACVCVPALRCSC
jgi:hypothetical protein